MTRNFEEITEKLINDLEIKQDLNGLREVLEYKGFNRDENFEGEVWYYTLSGDELINFVEEEELINEIEHNYIKYGILYLYPVRENIEVGYFQEKPEIIKFTQAKKVKKYDYEEVLEWLMSL